jgi:hypothetical protein
MATKKLIESTPNSLNLLGVGELTPYDESTLMPVSNRAGYHFSTPFFSALGHFVCSF